MMHWIPNICLGLMLIPALSATSAHAEEPSIPQIDTIDGLWAGFDPRRDPLEIETVKTWEENGIAYESLYFTSETFEGEKVRIYALRGAPVGAKGLPAIVHMHGGGQTASPDWVTYWAKRGYLGVSFDWLGTWKDNKREHYAHWGKVRGNMMEVNPGLDMTPTPRSNTWFHWIMAARRVITLAEQDPRCDSDRIGFFGISMGGFMTWNVAALDQRVKAACAFYGHGWDSYPVPPDLPNGPPDHDKLLYRALICSESYAPRITCPILFLSGSNDFCIGIDRAFDTLDLTVNAEHRQAFTVHQIHQVEPDEAHDLPLWMDWHLRGGPAFPASPGIAIAGDHIPEIRVAAAEADRVERVEIYYSLNDPKPQSRLWRPGVAPRKVDGIWYADAPFLTADDRICAYANVIYRDGGPSLSTRLLKADVRDLPGTTATLPRTSLIDPMTDFSLWYSTAGSPDPTNDQRPLIAWSGPNDEKGFTVNVPEGAATVTFGLATHALADPQWHRSGGRPLAFDLLSSEPLENLVIHVTEQHWQAHAREYTATPRITASDPGRITYEIVPADFKAADGTPLSAWDKVDYLQLQGSAPANAPPVFKRLRWLDKPAAETEGDK